MKTITIQKENAIQAYNDAPADFKKVLATLLGPDVISQKITDRVKTFADACQVLGLEEDEELPYKDPQTPRQIAVQSFTRMIIIAEALNEGWIADYADSKQEKWYIWFDWDKTKSGFGFSGTRTYWADTYTNVGARLSFKSQELAIYAGTQFTSIFNGFISPNPIA